MGRLASMCSARKDSVSELRTSAGSRSDAERNRRGLLEAAADALAENPGASMAEVARAAGLTRATLYRHFSNRQQLLEAMRAEALVRATHAIAASRLEEGSALEALHRVVEALLREGRRFRALLLAGADEDPVFLQERMAVFGPLQGVVQRGQAAGLIRADLPPGWVVAVIAALLASGVRMAPELPADDRALADLVFATLTTGVSGTDVTMVAAGSARTTAARRKKN
jgi:AcrR family transcriptional regulator